MASKTANIGIIQETFRKKGVVVLPLRAYEKMRELVARLEEETRALRVIAQGEREYKTGKLKPVRSLRQLL